MRHPVLVAAHELACLHRARRLADAARLIEIDCARAGLVNEIDRWVATTMPPPYGAATMHSETVGMVVDRLVQFSINAYAALTNGTPDAQLHYAWRRLAELTIAYADLAAEVAARTRDCPISPRRKSKAMEPIGAVTMTDNHRAAAHALLEQIRRIGASNRMALEAATVALSDREKDMLASQLTRVAAHIAARGGNARGLPLPEAAPGGGTDRIDLSAQLNAVPVAEMFVRNTLHKWGWAGVLVNAERVTHELTTAFVTAIEHQGLATPTRMTLRLRAVSSARLVVELHDSPENATIIGGAGRLISECVERISVRYGRHSAGGRTVLWCELERPQPSHGR
ncbi:DUF4254 domain-containing protein [Nocardia amamiensis]|uniref:DUF4254 domain-containing protein n=1 Tax=Nocardia amamiensis TaxID=404578 RepID=UPI000ADAEA4B|nr:DUF4254 domain-containing protein [Nocardia amamiensis]